MLLGRIILGFGVLVIFVIFGVFILLFPLLIHLRPTLVERFLCEQRILQAGVELAAVRILENLKHFHTVADVRLLKIHGDAVDGVEIRIVVDFLGAHVSHGIAHGHFLANRQVR